MSTITLEEIQQQNSLWLQRIAAGETLLVLQAGEPVAEIKPVENDQAAFIQPRGTPARPYGLAKGDFVVPNDFHNPLPDWLLNAFEGK